MTIKHIVMAIISLSLILSSCRKDKLEGEKELLKGTWKWTFSNKRTFDQTQPFATQRDTIFAVNCSDKYELDFLEKGIVKAIKNDDITSRKRIIFSDFGEIPSTPELDYAIIIHLNGNDNRVLAISVQNDTLCTNDIEFTGIPFRDDPPGDEPGDNLDIKYTHYYIRE